MSLFLPYFSIMANTEKKRKAPKHALSIWGGNFLGTMCTERNWGNTRNCLTQMVLWSLTDSLCSAEDPAEVGDHAHAVSRVGDFPQHGSTAWVWDKESQYLDRFGLWFCSADTAECPKGKSSWEYRQEIGSRDRSCELNQQAGNKEERCLRSERCWVGKKESL